MWKADFPFLYTYTVRLRSPASALNLIICEWVPIAVVLSVLYSASPWITFLMLAGNFALYECGYLINDLADSEFDAHGRYRESHRVNQWIFYSSRVIFFAMALIILLAEKGIRFALTYGILAAFVLLGFFWHTSRWPRSFHFLRIFSFTFLQLYKYVPIVAPQVSLRDSVLILTGIFFCWGLWRVFAYILIKDGAERTRKGQDFDPFRLLHPMSLIICGPMLLSVGAFSPKNAFAALWVMYAGIAVMRSCFQLTKWKLTWR